MAPPCDEPIADRKVKLSFKPTWLPIDRDELPDEVSREFTAKVLLLTKSSDGRRSILIRRETEPGHAFDHDRLSR
jgi:hypothetical protein